MRLAGIGAVAGLASWLLVYALRLMFDAGSPSIRELLWAVPRGALFGVILGLILGAYWDRRENREPPATRTS